MVKLKDLLPDPNDPQDRLMQSAAQRLAESVETLNRSSIDISNFTKQPSAFDAILEQLAEKKEPVFVEHLSPPAFVSDFAEQRRRGDEKLQLMRRQTIASEQAIADARRREAEAKAETRRAYSIAVVAAFVGLVSALITAWPYISVWWQ